MDPHGEKGKYVVRRVEGGLSVENSKNWRKRQNVISVNRMISALMERRSPVLFGSGVEGLPEPLGMRVGEQQKLKEFDLSNPWSRLSSKNATAKIFRLRKRYFTTSRFRRATTHHSRQRVAVFSW